MPEYDKTNTLSINRNDKGDNEARPDFKGDLNVDGVRYFVSLWQRTNKADGTTFLSGPVERADDKYQPNGGGSEDKPADKPAGDKQYF